MNCRIKFANILLLSILVHGSLGCKKAQPPAVANPENEIDVPPPSFTVQDSISKPMTKGLRKGFLSAEFKTHLELRDLPPNLYSKLFEILDGQKMANPNERFNATDVVIHAEIPHRRLILAGSSRDLAFVYYEHGGIGHHEHLLIFRRGSDDAFSLQANLYPNGRPDPMIGSIKTLLNNAQFSEAREA